MKSLHEYIDSRDQSDCRGYVSSPTGSGKTVVFTRLLEDLRSQGKLEPTLIIVPTKLLKQQTENRLREHGFKGRIVQVNGQIDMPKADVHITTQAGFARQINERGRGIVADRIQNIIFDEVHHIQGESTREALQRFAHARIIGFTATPDYDKKRVLSNILPDLIHEITTHEAIDEQLITPYVTIGLPTFADMRYVVVTGKDYHQKLLRRAIDNEERDKLIASYYRENMMGIPTLFNMSWVEHANRMAETLRSFGIRAETVHGGLHPDHEQRILSAFEAGEIDVITQVRKLGEGHDSKRISAVVNVSPTRSKVLSQQRVGRAQRTDQSHPDKVTLVVECIDQDYTGTPALYGSHTVTGHWTYGAEPAYAERFTTGGFDAVYDPELLTDWYCGIWKPAGQSHSVIERVNPDKYETLQPLPKTIKNPLAKRNGHTTRRSVARRPRQEGPSKASQARQRQHILTKQDKRRSRRTEADEFFDFDREPDLHEKMHQFKDPAQAAIAAYIIDGIVPDATSMEQRSLKRVLAELAGDEVLDDHATRSRFLRISEIAAGTTGVFIEDEYTGELRKPTKQFKKTSAEFMIDKPVFENPLCEADPNFSNEEQRAHTDRFFPERGQSTTLSKAICRSCGEREACLDYAIEAGTKFGIWGGLSERQRRELRRIKKREGESAYQTRLVEHYEKDARTFKNVYDCPTLPELLPITETPVSIR